MRRAALARCLAACRRRQLPWELLGYGFVSAVALSVDYGLLVALTEWAGLHYLVSAAVGFTAGLAIAYGLSVALVFRVRRYADARIEFAVFCLVGLIGLGLTQAVLHLLVAFVGMPYTAAKLPTAAAVFLFNFVARRRLLFSPDRGVSETGLDVETPAI